MSLPVISTLPPAPLRTQEPDTFATKADAFIVALPGFVDELNAFADALPGAVADATTGGGFVPASTLAASGGAAMVGFTQAGTGAVARTVQDKLREVEVSVTDYGAAFGASAATNDAAFANAIADVRNRGGGRVRIPAATYDLTTINVPAGVSVHLVGDGEQSVLRTTSATADLLTLNAWYSSVSNVKFTSSVTRTAGYYVGLVGAYTRISDCHITGDYIGVKMSGVGAKIARNVFSDGAVGARRIWATGGDTSQTIENNLMAAQAPAVAAGIFVDNSHALKIINNDVIGQGRCLHISPSTGQSVFSLWSRDNFYDTATIGIAIEAIGSGGVYRCTIEDDWASSHTNKGVIISTVDTAVIDGLDLDGVEVNLNGSDGIAMAGTGVKNIRIYGTPIARNNVGAALAIGAGADKVFVDGLQCQAADGLNANAYGAFIDGAAGAYEIRNCNFSGQGTANVSGWSPGTATKVMKDNIGFVTQSRGVATINNGSGSVTVTHGLAGTPTRIVITPRNDPAGRSWCENGNRTSTQFTINQSNAAVGYNVTYDWVAFYE